MRLQPLRFVLQRFLERLTSGAKALDKHAWFGTTKVVPLRLPILVYTICETALPGDGAPFPFSDICANGEFGLESHGLPGYPMEGRKAPSSGKEEA